MNKHEGVSTLLSQKNVTPMLTAAGRSGFETYLIYCGVDLSYINLDKELIVPPPNRVEHWKRAGEPSLIPDWAEGRGALAAALNLFCYLRREGVGPGYLRYGYRPKRFNKEVGGAPGSDHIYACAVDIDWTTDHDRMRALGILSRLYATKVFKLSIGTMARGVEGRRMHIGVWAPKTMAVGQRTWPYGGDGPIW